MSQMAYSKTPIILQYRAINTYYHEKSIISVQVSRNVVVFSKDGRCKIIENLSSRHITLIRRRHNVDATSWRCIDIVATLYKRHVPAGVASTLWDVV